MLFKRYDCVIDFSIFLSGILILVVFVWVLRNGYTSLGIGTNPYKQQIHPLKKHRVSGSVRFVCISDTHNVHDQIQVPEGDVLLHAGDFTIDGSLQEVKAFNDWIGKLPHKHKIVIAGNHDLILDPNLNSDTSYSDEEIRAHGKKYLSKCTYIYNESINVEGVRIFGSPHQPYLIGEDDKYIAFTSKTDVLERVYEEIPRRTDVLLTHGPPLGRQDQMFYGKRVGCPVLAAQILKTRPKYCVFGHVHSGYGVDIDEENEIEYINAAICTVLYHPIHDPVVFDVIIKC